MYEILYMQGILYMKENKPHYDVKWHEVIMTVFTMLGPEPQFSCPWYMIMPYNALNFDVNGWYFCWQNTHL